MMNGLAGKVGELSAVLASANERYNAGDPSVRFWWCVYHKWFQVEAYVRNEEFVTIAKKDTRLTEDNVTEALERVKELIHG